MNPGPGYVLQLQTLAEGSDGTYKVKQNTAELKALSVVGHQKSQGCRKSSHQLVTNWMLMAKIQVRIE